MSYEIAYTSRAKKDVKKLKGSIIFKRYEALLQEIKVNPYSKSNDSELIINRGKQSISKRISRRDRLVYYIDEASKIIKIESCLGHPNTTEYTA